MPPVTGVITVVAVNGVADVVSRKDLFAFEVVSHLAFKDDGPTLIRMIVN